MIGLAAAARRGLAEREPGTEWSPIVYPLQRLPLVFSHARHLARGTACAACHPDAATSRSAVDDLLPTEAACRACHPIDRAQPELVVPSAPPVACRACHPGYAPGASRGSTCRRRRSSSITARTARPRARAATAICARSTWRPPSSCRRWARACAATRDGAEPRHCADCHLAKLGGLIETRFEHGTLAPAHDGLGDAHGPGFRDHHTQEARQIGATCTACHDPSECVACHQGVTRPMEFHPGNYVMTHAVDARRGKPDCSACHRAQSFCVGCHEREGLGTRGDTQFSASDPARAFHPPGWASAGPGPNLHAREARRGITSCASCHREDECLKCHSAQPGAPHISPHPAGWRGSAQCRALDRGNRRMCLRCHIAQDELGCDWSAR